MGDLKASTLLPMGRTAEDLEAGWTEYFRAASEAAGFVGRGWKADLARAANISDATIGRWSRAERIPEPDSCRVLATAWRRPFLEVLVAAGHVDPEEAKMAGRPAPPAVPRTLAAEVARLQDVLDRPTTSAEAKERIRLMLRAVADLVDAKGVSALDEEV